MLCFSFFHEFIYMYDECHLGNSTIGDEPKYCMKVTLFWAFCNLGNLLMHNKVFMLYGIGARALLSSCFSVSAFAPFSFP